VDFQANAWDESPVTTKTKEDRRMTLRSMKMGMQVSLLIAALASSVRAVAGTDLEGFQNRLGKSAAFPNDYADKPKGTCICLDTRYAGVLRQVATEVVPTEVSVYVDCQVPIFDTNGARVGFTSCLNFLPLPK
jgi:hypothetical protein